VDNLKLLQLQRQGQRGAVSRRTPEDRERLVGSQGDTVAASPTPNGTSSVNRELSRIDLHVRHAKEFIQMGLPYSEDLLGELKQIKSIADKAIAKAEDDVVRADQMEPPARQTLRFDDVADPLDLSVPLGDRA
jgi:hypothetical protein